MARTYRATGINLKGMPLGEKDKLLTVLTKEYGLIRVVAPGARKYGSKLGGRAELFVVNDLLITQGRTLDRITQAETQESFLVLGQNLAKLTCAQYLAEIVLKQALTDQPQVELFSVFTDLLHRIQSQAESPHTLPIFVQGIYRLLALAGFAPQLYRCCISQELWDFSRAAGRKIPFSVVGGGVVKPGVSAPVSHYLTAQELRVLQTLAAKELPPEVLSLSIDSWLVLERVLRAYTQYHLEMHLQSADLIDRCFPV
ncbi:MAG: DNA repair protein RecO [Pseudanabaenaceae cyanobacterium SKYGB_i_bin29]|nr:DNA repair protein RecO [Pseudanabaenaceae cyanobacterium SKYG29]MDW8422372.1 DNA repair protein RecO [Pseudanabaenaceae cyanobacterium SKYGB_i_bin29]